VIAQDLADKKGAPGGGKAKGGDEKKDKGDKKKVDKPFPGPGAYEMESIFKTEKKGDKGGSKEKKELEKSCRPWFRAKSLGKEQLRG